MQVIFGVATLAVIGAVLWLKYVGIAQAERTVARWLLADARARDARAREFAAAKVSLAEIQ